MVKFCPLFSGSSGNSTFLSYHNTALLVDAGVSCKRITQALWDNGGSLEQIQAILVTHEHSDHIQGLKIISKRYHIPIYASAQVLDYLIGAGCVAPGTTLIEIAGPTEIGEILVTPFDTPHDSVHSLGFRFELGAGHTIGLATDLGHISSQVEEQLAGCDLVMLESNYDPAMLDCSRYPYSLKQRIKGRRGHLSNLDCAAYLTGLAQQGTTRFVLSHLSQENNMPEVAYQTVRGELLAGGLGEGDFSLQVARRSQPSEPVCL